MMLNTFLTIHHVLHDLRRHIFSPARGQGFVEYAFILCLIVVVVIAAVTVIGASTNATMMPVTNGF